MTVLSSAELIDLAISARKQAVAPYSRFPVGAVVETDDGRVFQGCNIESASYGLTVCAERVAIWKALSEGYRHFTRLVVVADTDILTPPCGACRQIIWEFCRDAEVTLADLKGRSEVFRPSDLLPRGFDSSFFKEQDSAE